MAYASARVTIPSVRPRRRSAGSPTTTPTAVANKAASSGAIGNGNTPALSDAGQSETAHAGEGELCERDLPGESGNYNIGQAEDGRDERADHGTPPRPWVSTSAKTPTAVPTIVGHKQRARPRCPPELLAYEPPRTGMPRPATSRRRR